MPRGDKSKYTDKEKRQAEHIEEGFEKRGVPKGEAQRRASPDGAVPHAASVSATSSRRWSTSGSCAPAMAWPCCPLLRLAR